MKIGREALELLGLHADGSTDRYDEDSVRFFKVRKSVTNIARKVNTVCGRLTSFFELSGLKRRGAPGGWAWSRSREGILQLCGIVVQ
jgi:hypothetical protein